MEGFGLHIWAYKFKPRRWHGIVLRFADTHGLNYC